MKKELGTIQALFPMPVLVIAAYDAKGTIQSMNAAWGQICDSDKIALFLDEDHATTKAIRETKAFTVALADRAHMAEQLAHALISVRKTHPVALDIHN